MAALEAVTVKALTVFLSALAVLVAIQLFNGGIRLRGLLRDTSPRGDFSPARLQMLVFTLAAAGQYMSEIMKSGAQGAMPAPAGSLVQILAASQALYAGSKAWQRLVIPWVEQMRKGR